jgi:hypothetical protein
MKKIVLFLLPTLIFGQKIETLQLLSPINDNSKTIKSLIVMDERPDKDLGTISFRDKTYHFEFPNNNSKTSLEEWFLKSNKKASGEKDVVLFIENIKVLSEGEEKSPILKAALKISTFIYKDGGYYFLDRIDKVININPNFSKYPVGLSNTISGYLTEFIKKSYKTDASAIRIDKKNLANYDSVLSQSLPALQNEKVKDGVYLTAKSFFYQEPLEGYELIKNDKNEVLRAKNNDNKIPAYKMFGYTENGKSYLFTQGGFMEINKDDKGFYLYSNTGTLFPVQMDSTYGMFGLIGAGIGAIDANAKNKKAQKEEKYNIYLDSLTGEFLIEK